MLFVVNNRGQLDFQIPLTANSATRKGFMKGACIGGMGTHYSFDLANRRGQMTWLANNLFPLMPMYDVDGSITAMLLPSISRQQTFDLYNVNQQDAVVIPNNLMCANWWYVEHFFFFCLFFFGSLFSAIPLVPWSHSVDALGVTTAWLSGPRNTSTFATTRLSNAQVVAEIKKNIHFFFCFALCLNLKKG